MKKLTLIPRQIPLMNSILSHLHNHGPLPTTAIFNSILEAHGRGSGIEKAESFLREMIDSNHSADQQSFRILIQASLSELNIPRAHYWLGEYSRQGFQISPRMMEPFMKCCVQQLMRCKNPDLITTDIGTPVDVDWYSREWKQKTLQLVQFMTSQRIRPTAATFELLIEGFLSQGDLFAAKKVLRQMRGSPHLYTPAPKTWRIFFQYYLSIDDPMSALRTLNEMRNALMQKTFHTSTVVVPTTLYHQLFRYLLHRGNLNFAEKSLYEMMINQDRRQPTESEVTELIWKLDRNPKGAQRVYELLYSHTRQPGFSHSIIPRRLRPDRKNRILEQGPIQMANVGLMRAKSKSRDDKLHQEVWITWKEMTSEYLGDESKHRGKEMSILGHAFAQLARASRKLPPPESSILTKQSSKNEKQVYRGDVDDDNQTATGWDFGQIRRSFGSNLGLGLNASKGGASANDSNVPSFMNVQGKNRMLIKQLFQRKEFIDPLMERHEALTESRATLSTLSAGFTDDVEENGALRLENLKKSFNWMQEQGIPITISGFNNYIITLISHGELDEAGACVDRHLLSSDTESGDNPVSIFHTLNPNVGTIEPFYGRKGQRWEQLTKKLVIKGGYEVRRLWRKRKAELHTRVGENK
ncbi:hypothetical protein BGZ76_001926 [Entomortierella beljakovae]|nr:hypothetical protein BGZ76_001926 [Entomortierella beljakovae]